MHSAPTSRQLAAKLTSVRSVSIPALVLCQVSHTTFHSPAHLGGVFLSLFGRNDLIDQLSLLGLQQSQLADNSLLLLTSRLTLSSQLGGGVAEMRPWRQDGWHASDTRACLFPLSTHIPIPHIHNRSLTHSLTTSLPDLVNFADKFVFAGS